MNSEKKEKILIYSAIGIVILLLIGAIIFIWRPLFKNIETSSLNRYDSTITYENMMKSYYSLYLEKYLKINNFDELYKHIDQQYLSQIGDKSEEELKDYLLTNGFISSKITINEIHYSNIDSTSALYRVFYTSNSGNKYVNISETDPYKFTISFEQDNISNLSSKKDIIITEDMVKYTFKLIDSDNNSVRYKLTIENNSDKQYDYDFSALNSIQIIYGENSYMNMASVANSSTVKYDVSPGSSKSIEILYNLPFENQMSVKGFYIRNVKIDNTSYNIKLEL